MQTIHEMKAWKINGFWMPLLLVILTVAGIFILREGILTNEPAFLIIFIPLILVIFMISAGFMIVHPNEAKVLVFFGKYAGTVNTAGFWWINPFTVRKAVSLRIHNFNSEKIKVNDFLGNPIEIAAVIVWRVVDSAKATFDVENYQQFVNVQCETAIRSMATQYPYDTHEEGRASLRGSQQEVSENLRAQVHTRLEIAGVEVTEARISHLAYAPEIAQVMLRRQQAEAIIAARQRIVDGAVGMVESALTMLGEKGIFTLDQEKKAAMANNLLVALVSDHETSPIVNVGTLFS